jgi:hypothetical protein
VLLRLTELGSDDRKSPIVVNTDQIRTLIPSKAGTLLVYAGSSACTSVVETIDEIVSMVEPARTCEDLRRQVL